MLILSRKVNERIMIGEEIEVSIVEIRGDQVKLGIVAPKTVKVFRREVYEAIQEENRRAVGSEPMVLEDLGKLFGSGDSSKGEPNDR